MLPLPRPADKIFLKLAVQGGFLTRQDADDVWDELIRLEDEREPTKARILCVEFGFMDKGLARRIKHEVRATLEKLAREESRSQRQVAGFELIQRISSGAMGTVFKARHLKLNKVVALKLLNPDFANDGSYVARFLQEAQAAASMNHKNVVQAYDVGQAGDVHFIAMEFVEGKTIKELIKRRGALEESAAIEIVLQVLDGLRHAWEHNLVHRDVKPANIMITKEGQAKLLDLGLVRRTDAANELTGEGKAIGTPYFMAPEQALDKGADYRADIYALGATLFNMVTGEKPYVAGTPVAVMQLHIKAEVPDATERNPRVSGGLSQVIKKMLAKRPDSRYQDPQSLVSDLTQVLSGFMPDLHGGETPIGLDSIRPRRGGDEIAGLREDDEPRRRRGGGGAAAGPPVHLLAAAGAAVLLLVGAIVFFMGGQEAPPPPPPSAPEVAKEDPREAEERAAQKLLDQIPRGDRWERVEDLEALAQRYPRTEAGRLAQKDATELRTQLTNREQATFDRRSRELTELAKQGKLVQAAEGYVALASELRATTVKDQAVVRARDLNGELERLRKQMDDRVRKAEQEGDQLAAAELIREKAALLPQQERDAELERAAKLVATVKQREEEQRQAAAKDQQIQEQRDEAAVTQLPATIVALIKEGELPTALELAKETAQEVKTPKYSTRAQVHVTALEAIVKLDELALAAFKERQGESVSLDRKKGGKVPPGTLAGVEGDKVLVKLNNRAEMAIPLEDLTDDTRWRKIRQVRGARDPDYLRGVTSLLLYRGDEEAETFLTRCGEEKLDLSGLVAELESIEAAPTEPEVVTKRPNDPEDQAPKQDEPQSDEDKVKKALEDREAAKALIAKRTSVFREASNIGYADEQLEPIYEFYRQQQFLKEWRLRQGRAIPTPPGQIERYGLRLEGRSGRAEFFAPLHKNVQVVVTFVPHGLSRNGRFAIVLEGEKGQRITNELGALHYYVKRRPKKRVGQNQILNLKSRNELKLWLIREGNTFIAKLGNQETGRFELPEDTDFGTYRLSLEWGRVNINLCRIGTLCSPDPDWIKKRLSP